MWEKGGSPKVDEVKDVASIKTIYQFSSVDKGRGGPKIQKGLRSGTYM